MTTKSDEPSRARKVAVQSVAIGNHQLAVIAEVAASEAGAQLQPQR